MGLYKIEIRNHLEGSKYFASNYPHKWREVMRVFRKKKTIKFFYASNSEFISFNIFYYLFFVFTSRKTKNTFFSDLWVDKKWVGGRWVSTCKYWKRLKKSELFNTRPKYFIK